MGYYRTNTLVKIVDVAWLEPQNLVYGRVTQDAPGTWQAESGNYVRVGDETVWCHARNLVVVEDIKEVLAYFADFFINLIPNKYIRLIQETGVTSVYLHGRYTADDLQTIEKHLNYFLELVGEAPRG